MPPSDRGTDATEARVRERLRQVRWIGGGSAAGKSTIAARLAAEHGVDVMATDDLMAAHARHCDAAACPLLTAFLAMDMDERWVQRSPQVVLDTFPWFRGECFDLIIDDLLDLSERPRVIVEGFRLLPQRVRPLLAEPRQAVWLLPTPAFRRSAAGQRGSGWEFLDRTSDPPTALHNLLERDRMFTDRLREETTRLGLTAIEVDSTVDEDEIAARVADALGLRSRAG